MTTSLTHEQVLTLQHRAGVLHTRNFDTRTPFKGDPLYIDEALTMIAGALTIIATVLAHQLTPVGLPGHPPGDTSGPTQP